MSGLVRNPEDRFSHNEAHFMHSLQKPYARSEVHLIEVFESVCEKFRDYAESTNSAGQRSVARTSARDGGTLSLSNIKLSAGTQKEIKFHVRYTPALN